MICPHCRVAFHEREIMTLLGEDRDGAWALIRVACPECKRYSMFLDSGEPRYSDGPFPELMEILKPTRILVHPRGSLRPPCPSEVPNEFAEDYTEACIVLPDSPKASAALSRRCLQHLLREVAKVKPTHLADEIQQVIDGGSLPSHIVEAIDGIRNIGNFAAHPIKSEKTGEIVGVEAGEAEWTLDVLEALFDFYFVQPERLKKKRKELDAKLKEAGKKPMK